MQCSRPGPGLSPFDASQSPARLIVGGVVAYNDDRRIGESLRSLLSQQLPPGVRWGRVWVVASGCTDRTVEVAQAIARSDPRVGLVVEAERRGKAAALRQVLARAEGDLLVLLNSDAVALPGSVAALIAKADGKRRPFAVMARPAVPPATVDAWSGTMRWMWELHHELHREMLEDGGGAHLSDELLLVSLPALPWIEDGVINDGSYCAVWLQNHWGSCWYAPEARVAIDVPRNPGDHLRQRRRIHVGNAQVAARLGRWPTTALRFFLEHPASAIRAWKRAVATPHGIQHFVKVAGWEAVAHALALWDRVPPRKDHVRWSRIATPSERAPARWNASSVASEVDVANRIRILLEVAREFRTGLPLERLAELLPEPRRRSEQELDAFLAGRPDLARLAKLVDGPPRGSSEPEAQRIQRGVWYQHVAETLVGKRLAWLHPWVRCVGVTGSTAYGAPSAGDDLDFYVVARTGSASWWLLATYLTLRIRRAKRSHSSEPMPCFNYVVDDRRAPVEFAEGRGLLFAREALTARLVLGDAYYRGLLARAPWLGDEIPSLFAARTVGPGDTTPRPASLTVRCLNALAFLPLATYLQLAGLVRNARARRRGEFSAIFRTLTAPDRFVFQSQRFEALRRHYEQRSETLPSSNATGPPSTGSSLSEEPRGLPSLHRSGGPMVGAGR